MKRGQRPILQNAKIGRCPLFLSICFLPLLGLLCCPPSFAQDLVGEPTQCDTVEVEAGCGIFLPDTTFTVGRDTVLVLPVGLPYEIRTPGQLRNDAFYDSLKANSERGAVRKALYDALIRKAPSAVTPKGFVKSELPFAPFEGMTIRSVRLKKVDVWAGSVEDTSLTAESGFSRTLNKLHVKTRDNVLFNILLFKEGDEVDPFVLADNERILRNLPYIEDARIYVGLSKDDSLGVDIIVVTKDVFPYGVTGNINSVNRYNVRAFCRNVAGFGHELSYRLLVNSKKEPSVGHEVKYTVENIRRTFTSGQLLYSNTWDIEQYRGSLSKRFLTPQTRWGGGLDAGVIRAIREEEADSVTVKTPYEYNLQDAWLGRSFPLPDPDSRSNIVFSGRFRRQEFTKRPEVRPDSNHFYHHKRLALGRITYLQVKYFKTSLIRSFGAAEDVPYGFVAHITSGIGDREFEDRPYLGIEVAAANYYKGFGYLGGNAGLGGFIDGQTVEEGVFTATVLYFSNLANRGRYNFRQLARLVYTVGIRRLPDETLDIDDKIRGLSGAEESNGHVALNLETVAFMPWDWYRFRFALYGYADLGFIDMDKGVFREDRSFGTVGIGCRIKNESLVFSTLNIQMGYLLRAPEGVDPWYIETSTETLQRVQPIAIAKPDVVRFE
jgi:hypothetical protein